MEALKWMIYGATGYTGRLVIEEALRRGHFPLLAGRSLEKLIPLAREYGLKCVAFELDDVKVIAEAIADMDIVYHAAGPFVHTSDTMIRACLATHTHYLDITGEIPVFENTFRYYDAAAANQIALISGVGFDVVPTDCLGAYVARQVPAATHLNIGILGFAGASAGTTKSSFEMLATGSYKRRDGRLLMAPFYQGTRRIPMPQGQIEALAVPWGDLSTAYHTTGIPNINTYLVMPQAVRVMAQLGSGLGAFLMQRKAIRGLFNRLADRFAQGPDAQARQSNRAIMWAEASNEAGTTAQAWLVTPEPYEFTARAAVLAVERVAELRPRGALTPAQAFGADFVLDIAGTARYDQLPDRTALSNV